MTLPLGAFSVSLSVRDLATSRAFYETLGFSALGGDADHGYLIMKNGSTVIGLFQGMFEGNILTFNPGWAQDASELDEFTDVREIQARLKAAGLSLTREADPDTEGPEHITLVDPDGNAILVDQHR